MSDNLFPRIDTRDKVTVKPHPKGKGCWYKTYISECPPCGRLEEIRERKWGKKPENPFKRVQYQQYHCGCMY